jgi:hypothetical protein
MTTQYGVLGAVVLVAALLAGVAIGFVDSRPAWDDTGVTAGSLLLAAGVLAVVRPRAWWLVGLLVGLPVPVFNYLAHGGFGSMIAIAFALAGAGAGAWVATHLGRAVAR